MIPTDAQTVLREAITQTRSAIDERAQDLLDLEEQVKVKVIERDRLTHSLKNLERNFYAVQQSDLNTPDNL